MGNPTSMLYVVLIFGGAYIIGMSGYVLFQKLKKLVSGMRRGK